MNEHEQWHELGQQLRADSIRVVAAGSSHPASSISAADLRPSRSRVLRLIGKRQRAGFGSQMDTGTGRSGRRFAVLVDAFRLVVRRVCIAPMGRRPTTWLSEPPRVVLPRVSDVPEFGSTTSRDDAACSPTVVLEPRERDAHAREVRQAAPSHNQHRETNTKRRRIAWDGLPERDRWDERDNVIASAGIDAALRQPQPPPDLATGSAARDGQASPDSRIAEFRSDPATWIAVGLGDPMYSPRDPRLRRRPP